jgi:hypothetical protein
MLWLLRLQDCCLIFYFTAELAESAEFKRFTTVNSEYA